MGIPSISGNQDRIIVNPSQELRGVPTFQFVTQNLDRDSMEWLKGLRPTASLYDDVLLCHGIPSRDDECLLERVTRDGVSV